MFYSIFRNEVAGAYAAAPEVDPKYWPVSFGLGAWLLAGAFVCRLLSGPIPFIAFVAILLATVFIANFVLTDVLLWDSMGARLHIFGSKPCPKRLALNRVINVALE